MALIEIPVPDGPAGDLPEAAERLVRESNRRIHAFMERTSDTPIPAFVPSDFRATYQALAWIRTAGLATGRSFCEWGSGFGTVALLASSVGFHALGIEVEPALVEESVALAAEFDASVEFVQGSFVPEGSTDTGDGPMELAWLDFSAAPAYDLIGLDPDDFDVVFAYPWPGEQHLVLDLFEAHAAAGALLLTYQGTEGLFLHRRERRPNRGRRRSRRPR